MFFIHEYSFGALPIRVWISVRGSVRIVFRVVFRVRVSLTIRFRGLLRNDVVVNPEFLITAQT